MRRARAAAIRSLGSRLKSAHPLLVPCIGLEWLCEHIVFILNHWAIIDLIKLIGSLSILWAALDYLWSADERAALAFDQRKGKHYQAWQVINTAQGRSPDGGRGDAISDLVKDDVALDGINLNSAMLTSLNAPRARFLLAEIRNASLKSSCLEEANFNLATLENSDLVGNNLRGAKFSSSDFSMGDLAGSDLEGASFFLSDLRSTVLPRSFLKAGNVDGANIYNVSFPGDRAEFLKWANEHGAVCIKSFPAWRIYRDNRARNRTTSPPDLTENLCAIGPAEDSTTKFEDPCGVED